MASLGIRHIRQRTEDVKGLKSMNYNLCATISLSPFSSQATVRSLKVTED